MEKSKHYKNTKQQNDAVRRLNARLSTRKQKTSNKAIGEHIAQLRKQQHKTQAELADELSVSRIAIVNWESGRYYPSDLDALAAALHTTADAIASYNAALHYMTLIDDLDAIVDKIMPKKGTTVQRYHGDGYLSDEIRKTIVAMLQPVIAYIESLPVAK